MNTKLMSAIFTACVAGVAISQFFSLLYGLLNAMDDKGDNDMKIVKLNTKAIALTLLAILVVIMQTSGFTP